MNINNCNSFPLLPSSGPDPLVGNPTSISNPAESTSLNSQSSNSNIQDKLKHSALFSEDEIKELSLLNNPTLIALVNSCVFGPVNKDIDLRRFAHTTVSSIVHESKFEGMSSSKAIHILNILIEKFFFFNPQFTLEFQGIQEQMKHVFLDCNKYVSTIDQIHMNTRSDDIPLENKVNLFRKFSSDVKTDILNLPIEKKLYFPGGYISKIHTGHALVFAFKKNKDNKFDLTIINTGDGLQYHPGIVNSKGESFDQYFLEFKNIPDSFLDDKFFEGFIGDLFIPMWDYDYANSVSGNFLYEHILPRLKVYLQRPEKNFKLYMRPQRAGTCSMKSLFALIRYFLFNQTTRVNLSGSIPSPKEDFLRKKQIYKLFRIEIQKIELFDLCNKYFAPDVPYDRNAHKLISDATKIFSKWGLKYYQFSEVRPNEIVATVQDIKTRLKQKKAVSFKKDITDLEMEKVPTFISQSPTLFQQKISLSDNMRFETIKPLKFRDLDFKLPVFPEAHLKPSDAIEILEAWSKIDLKRYTSDDVSILVTHSAEQLKKLPVPNKKNDQFWNQIPVSKIEVCLKGLFNLLKCMASPEILKSPNLQYINDFSSASKALEGFNALAIADYLANLSEGNYLSQFTIFNKHLKKFVEHYSNLFFNPSDCVRLEGILSYFDLKKDKDSKMFKIPIDDKFLITNNSLKTNPELKFYLHFVKDFKLANPSIKYKKTIDYVHHIATKSRLENPLIPKTVIYLKNICYLSQIISSHSFSAEIKLPQEETPHSITDLGFEFTYKPTKKHTPKSPKLSLSIYNHNEIIKIDSLIFRTHSDEHFEKNLRKISQNQMKNELLENEENEIIINVNADDEIIRVLNYIDQCSYNDLESKNVQKLIQYHFFKFETLLHQILNEPQSALKIKAKLDHYISFFKDLKKWNLCIFFLKIASIVTDFITFSQNQSPQKFKNIHFEFIKDYRKFAYEEILPNINNEMINFFFETLKNLWMSKKDLIDQNTLKMGLATDFFAFHIMKNYASTESTNYDFSEFDYFNDSQIPKIIYEVKTNRKFRNQLLNNLVKIITNYEVDFDWNGNFPTYSTTGYIIDLEKCVLNGKSKQYPLIPNSLIQNLSNKKFYKILDNIKSIKSLDENITTVTDDNGISTLEIKNGSLELKRIIDGHPVQLISLGSSIPFYGFESFKLKRYSFEDLLPVFHFNKSSIWKILDKPNIYLILNLNKEKYYLECSSVKEENPSSLLRDIIPNNFIFDHDLEYSAQSIFTGLTTVLTIDKISDNLDFSQVLVNYNSIKNFEILRGFASSEPLKQNKCESGLLLWAEKSNLNRITKIEMPLVKQTFLLQKDKEGIERYYSIDKPDYYLAEDQLDQYRSSWAPYLILENREGNRIVLINKYHVSYKDDSSDFNGPIYKANGWDRQIYAYQLLIERGKIKLIPNCIESALNLILMLLITKKYKQTLNLIPYCQSVRDYTEQEINLFKSFYSYNGEYPGGGHPSASFIRLKVVLCAFEKENMSKFNYGISEDYKKYLNNFHNNFIGCLTTTEELKLLKYFLKEKDTDAQFVERLNLIVNDGVTNPTINNDQNISVKKTKNISKIDAWRWKEDFKETHENYLSQEVFNSYYDEVEVNSDSDVEDDIERPLPYFSYPALVSKAQKNLNENLIKVTEFPLKPLFQKKIKENIDLSNDLNNIDINWTFRLGTLKNASRSELLNVFQEHQKRLEDKAKNLIDLANQISSDEQMIAALKYHAQRKKKVDFQNLLYLFEVGSLENYREATYLSDQQIIELDKEISLYLIESTRNSQLKKIIELRDELKNNEDAAEKNLIEEQIANEFMASRQYQFVETHSDKMDVDQTELSATLKRNRESEDCKFEPAQKKIKISHAESQSISETKYLENLKLHKAPFARSYLLMEYHTGILLRKIQTDLLKSIEECTDHSEQLIVAGPGSGKSKVLAPLFQRMRQKDRLVFNLWPQSLYKTNKEDIKNHIRDVFGQNATAFEFDRSTKILEDSIINLKNQLVQAWNNNTQINTTPESLQCFELKYIEILHGFSKGKKDYPPEILITMTSILNMIHEGEFHIDEAHINLSPCREVNYTLGTPTLESPKRIRLVKNIFKYLSSNKVDQILGLREDRQRFVKPEKIKEILTELCKHLAVSLKVKPDQMSSYLEFVFGGEPADWMYQHPDEELFVLLSLYITKFLPASFEKSVNVNFGLSHALEEVTYAKPYRGNDKPIENAEYENVHETLAKTFITYLFQGLSVKNIWKLIKKMQFLAEKEAKEKNIEFNRTRVFAKYEKIFGNEHGNLFSINENIITDQHKHFQFSKELILYFVSFYVAPTIVKYPYKIRSTTQDLLNMSNCKNLIMTATPGRIEFYRTGLNTISSGLGSKQILDKIVKDQSPIHIAEGHTTEEVMKFALDKLKGDFRMLIDVGALFKCLSNKQIALELLSNFKENPEIQGILFFDHNDQMMVLRKDSNDVKPYTQCDLKPKQLFTYCDQAHAFGTDTKQFSKAKALVTFDLNTTLDELTQGVGRLRQFLRGQKSEFLLCSRTGDLINSETTLNIDEILAYAKSNQDELEIENCLRSLQQQIIQEVRKVLLKKFMKCSDINKLSSLFNHVEDFFLEDVRNKFSLPSKDNMKDVTNKLNRNPLYDSIENLKSKISALPIEVFTELEQKEVIEKIESYSTKIQSLQNEMEQLSKRRHKPLSFSAVDMEIEVQNQNEIQNEKENENESEVHQYSSINGMYGGNEYKWPSKMSLFDQSWPKITPPFIDLNNQEISDHKNNSNVPLCTLKEVIVKHAENSIADAHKIILSLNQDESSLGAYENRLLLTANFITNEPFIQDFGKLFMPFSKQQKSIYEVLIIEDMELKIDGKSKWTVIVGDQSTDAKFWRKSLENRSKEETSQQLNLTEGSLRRVCLYDLQFGIVQSGINAFTDDELKNNKELQILMVQVKLINGNLDYFELQRDLLKRMAPDNEAKIKLFNFFERAIFWKPQQRQLFKESWLKFFLTR